MKSVIFFSPFFADRQDFPLILFYFGLFWSNHLQKSKIYIFTMASKRGPPKLKKPPSIKMDDTEKVSNSLKDDVDSEADGVLEKIASSPKAKNTNVSNADITTDSSISGDDDKTPPTPPRSITKNAQEPAGTPPISRILKKTTSMKKDKSTPSPRGSTKKVPEKSPEVTTTHMCTGATILVELSCEFSLKPSSFQCQMLAHEAISAASRRRLEVKVRTRKLLARKASNREIQNELNRKVSELGESVKAAEEPVEFDVVRKELESMITDKWDPTGKLRAMLMRLTWHSVSTYDSSNDNIGGLNNGGYGGSTMRFSPERDDHLNRGLLQVAERVLGPIKAKHPKLSHADLWVLASYVTISSLGGPRIDFVGGRFDAKDGSKCPRTARFTYPARLTNMFLIYVNCS